jgi:hypothetical protein
MSTDGKLSVVLPENSVDLAMVPYRRLSHKKAAQDRLYELRVILPTRI